MSLVSLPVKDVTVAHEAAGSVLTVGVVTDRRLLSTFIDICQQSVYIAYFTHVALFIHTNNAPFFTFFILPPNSGSYASCFPSPAFKQPVSPSKNVTEYTSSVEKLQNSFVLFLLGQFRVQCKYKMSTSFSECRRQKRNCLLQSLT